MANTRIRELAQELGLDSSELLKLAKQFGFQATTTSSSLGETAVERLRRHVRLRQHRTEWMELDRVLTAVQSSILRADKLLEQEARKAKEDIQYVVADLNIEFPVEFQVDSKDRPLLRFPQPLEHGEPLEPATHLTRLKLSLRPVPTLRQES
ncbi:MAG: translation initiation factor IF-2 N-terminal domain-containing protein [Phycisphaerae bacterium]|nr:translation initiation factor IF-2 N-terminal domain-containing protein [Phycisphaerae bacterium]